MERLTRKSASGKYTPVFEGITATVADYYKCVERLAEIENILGETYDLAKAFVAVKRGGKTDGW